MITCTRSLEIDAGHRLLNHEGKCRNYHGHRYVFEVTCAAAALDDVGRVIDFSAIKELVGRFLDDQWDHGMILQTGDPMYSALKAEQCKVYLVDCPPTAENLARLLFEEATKLLPKHISVVRVKCYETPNCIAEYAP